MLPKWPIRSIVVQLGTSGGVRPRPRGGGCDGPWPSPLPGTLPPGAPGFPRPHVHMNLHVQVGGDVWGVVSPESSPTTS